MAPSRQPVFTMSLLVTGNLLGAGILALPINLGPAGMIPAAAGIVLVWALMLVSSLILADQKELTQGETGGLPTFFETKLGWAGKWITVAADLVVLYGVLTAYLVGVSTILVNLFDLPLPQWAVCLAYFAVVCGLTSVGMGLLRACNAAILIAMGVCFLILIAMTLGHVNPQRMAPMRWGFLPAAMPLVLTAFLYHNIIPTLCRQLGNDRRAIHKTLWIGSSIGLVMNLLWTVVVFCALPFYAPKNLSILNAYNMSLPATIPLSGLLHSGFFTYTGLVFAVLAMTAAFMANGTALIDFLRDLGRSWRPTRQALVLYALAFLPPLGVSIFNPGIFLGAMNVVGGFGVCVIFGILPAAIVLRERGQSRKKLLLGLIMLLLFGLILVSETFQELGLSEIKPDLEYWYSHGQ